MNILVIGGSGFIGSHIVDKLKIDGLNVKVFDIKEPHRNDVEFIKGDIVSIDELKAAMKDVEYVFHIAALSDINIVAKNPLKAIDLNIMSTAKVLVAACKSHVERVIYASSYFAGSGMGHLYTTTKVSSELICKDYNSLYGLPFTILRYGTAYGPRSRGEDVISIFIERALSGKPLVINGDGKQTRNFIYVEDLAEGNVASLQDIATNMTYNLEGPGSITIKEVAETIQDLVGNVKIEYRNKRINDFEGKIVSIKKAKQELKWEPKVTFKKGVEMYIEWYKDAFLK